jgi:multicomponent Na+:H+ antiporter subunit F
MIGLHLVLVVLLLATILAGLVRVVRGPTAPDRILAAQLFGTTGVAVMILLAEAVEVPALRDVALVFVLLAVLATVAFVRQLRPRDPDGGAS